MKNREFRALNREVSEIGLGCWQLGGNFGRLPEKTAEAILERAAFHGGETFGGLPFEKGVDLVDALRPYCPDGYTMAEFAQRFILDHPQVTTVITGASRVEQVDANARVG